MIEARSEHLDGTRGSAMISLRIAGIVFLRIAGIVGLYFAARTVATHYAPPALVFDVGWVSGLFVMQWLVARPKVYRER